MALALGGISAPIPVLVYAWVGDTSSEGAFSQTVNVSGFSNTDIIEVEVYSYSGGVGAITINLKVNDGALKTIWSYTGVANNATFSMRPALIGAANQISITGGGPTTTAISIENIVSFTVDGNGGGAGTAMHICGITVKRHKVFP